ncbi:RidA family protein [Sedimentimonas flavescens]|uniref:RidA family protein n=1 Tax=Sedimentimonas flavescens TaxID=2851012 RepID=UPI001C4A526A|nr:RidA family protein [Sedimentimonas flavescens]MBW0158857.1 RidA family protein [Sedimentimonas flavescens]
MAEIKRIECGARMSEAVVYNGLIWLAGQVGAPGESVTAQTKAILASIDQLLAEAGSDKTRILSAQIWLADIADFAEMNTVWDAWVPAGHCPARATGEARLATPDYRVEIIITAAQA